jgi:hypothetical protein
VIGRLGDLQLLGHLRHLKALGEQAVGLPQLGDDLLRGVPRHFIRVLLPMEGGKDSHTRWTNLRGCSYRSSRGVKRLEVGDKGVVKPLGPGSA